ncbi:MAG: tetratricopeptide repeat protein [Kiritimatiellia bacterium]
MIALHEKAGSRVAMRSRDRLLWFTGMLVMLVGGGVGVDGAGLPFEPEVSTADRRLLQAALAVGQTNLVAAAEMLDSAPRRGAAIAFAAGNFYFQAEAYGAAQRAYEEALEKLPRFRAAKANLGRIYLLRELPQEAMRLYRELAADGQADADIYLLLGHALQLIGRPVSAESAFRNALLLDPEKREALVGLVQTLFEQQRFQEALSLTAEILAMAPGNRDVWRLRANAFLLLEQHPQAIRAIEVARRLGLADEGLLALQGDLLINAGQPADAREAYRAAFAQRAPSAERVLRAIEGFLMLDDTDGARSLMVSVESTDWSAADRATWLRMQAQLAWQEQDADAAIDLAREALTLNPLDGRGLLLLASIAEAGGQAEQAILYCERAARISAYEVAALIQQAQIEVGRNRYARAISLLETAQIRRAQPHVERYLEQLRRMQM